MIARQVAPASHLLGRERELGVLHSVLDEALEGRGGAALLVGGPGIGKTRLAEELVTEAIGRGALIAWGHGWDGGGAPEYWPWAQIVRSLAARHDLAALAPRLGPGAGWLAQLAPELAEGLPPHPDIEGEHGRFAVLEALAELLRAAAEREPVVIVLDDLHLMGEPALVAVRYAARAAGTARLLLLGCTQPGRIAARPELDELLSPLERHGPRLDLPGLSEDDVARLIEAMTGAPAAPGLAARVHETTEGNPFYSQQVVSLIAAGDPGERLPLPEGVRATLRRRLAPLPAQTRSALDCAAVIGREFRLTTLAAALGDRVHRALERTTPARAAGLLDEVPGHPGRARFAHGLIREVLQAELESSARMGLHRAIGEALERHPSADTHLTELAHHFVAAAPLGDAERAVDYAERAARRALALHAYEQSAELFEEALGALELVELPDEGARRAALLHGVGRARARTGDPRATAALVRAADAALAEGDGRLYAQCAIDRADFALPGGTVDDELVGLLERALTLLGPGDAAMRVRVLVRLALALHFTPAVERRQALVEKAIALARPLNDPATLAYALSYGRLAIGGADVLEQSLAWADELSALGVQDAGEVALQALAWRIDVLTEAGDLVAAEAATALLERRAAERRDARAQARARLLRARRAIVAGRWEDADALMADAANLAAAVEDHAFPVVAGALAFRRAWLRGELAPLEAVVRGTVESLPGMPVWRCALSVLLIETGRAGEARRELDALLAGGLAQIPRDTVELTALTLLGEAVAAVGTPAHADLLEARLAPFAGRLAVSPGGVLLGPIVRVLGRCAFVRGEFALAAQRAAAAREQAAALNLPVALAEATADEGEARARGGEDAGALLAEAAALAERLQLPRLAARVAALRGPSAPPEPAPVGPAAAALALEGEMWVIAFEERAVHVRDAKGMRHLARLLAHPGVEIHALELGGGGGETLVEGTPEAALDPQAKAAYRERIAVLREEVDEAERFHDPERAEHARAELDFVARELAGAVGLGGRDRPTGSSAEKARVNVTRAIKTAIRRIGELDPALGRELEVCVRTGTFCVYEPDPRRPVQWHVDGS